MKRLTFFLTLISIVTLSLSLSSCKKDDKDDQNTSNNSNNGNNNGGGNNQTDPTIMSFTATAGQSSFAADTNAISYSFDTGLNLHVFTIPDTTNRVFTIMLASLDAGTYDVDFDNAIVSYQIGTTAYTGGFNPQGTFTISSSTNNKLTGTFNAELFDFSTANTLSITNGAFQNIPY